MNVETLPKRNVIFNGRWESYKKQPNTQMRVEKEKCFIMERNAIYLYQFQLKNTYWLRVQSENVSLGSKTVYKCTLNISCKKQYYFCIIIQFLFLFNVFRIFNHLQSRMTQAKFITQPSLPCIYHLAIVAWLVSFSMKCKVLCIKPIFVSRFLLLNYMFPRYALNYLKILISSI